MDTNQLITSLAKNPDTRTRFSGVFSSDQIPWADWESKNDRAFYIFNLDTSKEPGSHWVSIMLDPCGNNFYFDSYGDPPENENFEKFMQLSYCYNNHEFQSIFSSNCGQWCMYFIWHMCVGRPFEKMIEKFSLEPQLLNDHLVSHLCNKMFDAKSFAFDQVYIEEQLCREVRQTCRPMGVNLKKQLGNYKKGLGCFNSERRF